MYRIFQLYFNEIAEICEQFITYCVKIFNIKYKADVIASQMEKKKTSLL